MAARQPVCLHLKCDAILGMPSSITTANRADAAIADTRRWLERAVIGLNLCPFAKAVHVKGQIHLTASSAGTEEDLLADLKIELMGLASLNSIERETTILLAPWVLDEFLQFNEFLAKANQMVVDIDLDGVIQIASFHPQYQFADAAMDDITNFTNRAPYPTLHLLREESIDRAVEAFGEASEIFEKNKETLMRLGHSGWTALDVGPHGEATP